MKRLKKSLAAAGASLLVLGGLALTVPVTANAASGTITGNIQCGYDNNQVVGAWVDVVNGTDGWATLSNDGYGGKNYSYNMSTSSYYTLHVGCGGTPQSWGGTFLTPTVNGQNYSWSCTVTGGKKVCAFS